MAIFNFSHLFFVVLLDYVGDLEVFLLLPEKQLLLQLKNFLNIQHEIFHDSIIMSIQCEHTIVQLNFKHVLVRLVGASVNVEVGLVDVVLFEGDLACL